MIFALVAFLLCLAIFVAEWKRAPEAYQDDTGFHFLGVGESKVETPEADSNETRKE